MARALLNLDPARICGARSALRVADASVHVWAFSLEGSAACLEQCRQALCPLERARGDRFVHAASRDHFAVAHGVLRHLLGRYLGCEAREVSFSSHPNGKPTLAAAGGGARVPSFNLTHSQGRALIAVSDGREVGIDLEKVKPDVKAVAIARRYFAAAELADIEGQPMALQADAFFRYWVAKEALLKGQGIGLRFPIDEFEVQFDADDSSARVRVHEPSRLDGDWTLKRLPVESGWAAALAVRGRHWTLSLKNSPHALVHGA